MAKILYYMLHITGLCVLLYMGIVLSVFLHLDNLTRMIELFHQGLFFSWSTKIVVNNNICFSYIQSSVGPLANF